MPYCPFEFERGVPEAWGVSACICMGATFYRKLTQAPSLGSQTIIANLANKYYSPKPANTNPEGLDFVLLYFNVVTECIYT